MYVGCDGLFFSMTDYPFSFLSGPEITFIDTVTMAHIVQTFPISHSQEPHSRASIGATAQHRATASRPIISPCHPTLFLG